MRMKRTPRVALIAAVAVAAASCAQLHEWGLISASAPDPVARDAQRARAGKELEVVVAVPGARVCRQLTLGIATREWIRATVLDGTGKTVRVRIDEPGAYSHQIDGIELKRGAVVSGASGDWIPCT